MKMILMGHRGVGKSHLLQRLMVGSAIRRMGLNFFDLDREIEKSTGDRIPDFFKKWGEAKFRDQELRQMDLVKKSHSDFVVALGAGFDLNRADWNDEERVWVRRKSDSKGRILLDRPSLNQGMSSLAEYQDRFQQREPVFKKLCSWIYDLPEGLVSPNRIEVDIFFNEVRRIGGGITLVPEHLDRWNWFLKREQNWDFDFFELRDDLLTHSQMDQVISDLPRQKILFSFRSRRLEHDWIRSRILEPYQAQLSGTSFKDESQEKLRFKLDWPQELGPSLLEGASFQIRSSHDSCPEDFGTSHLKWSPEVSGLGDLVDGLEWQEKDPLRRSFLPRTPASSDESLWVWARCWLKGRQQLNFLNSGWSMVQDQPSYFDWLSTPWMTAQFGAVLGQPVSHSHSPAYHLLSSAERGEAFFAIPVARTELAFSLKVLRAMGLIRAAVTSPLKTEAFESDQVESSELARRFRSVNTLTWSKDNMKWTGDNTDWLGLEESLNAIHQDFPENRGPVLVWGGGGTRGLIQAKYSPQENYFLSSGSVEHSLDRQAMRESIERQNRPKGIIWAASPWAGTPIEREFSLDWLSEVRWILDLNYRLDSRSRELARQLNCRFYSGEAFFRVQAEAQEKIWGESHVSQ